MNRPTTTDTRTVIAPAGEPSPGAATPASGDSAVVAGHSVMCFVSGLSEQNRKDVLDSTLLMQLQASARFDQATQRKEWFKEYTSGLKSVGWDISSEVFESYAPKQQSFTLEGIALELLGETTGNSTFAPIVKKSLAALRTHENTLRVLESSADNGTGGMFQILPCMQSPTGEVSMLMDCIGFKTNHMNYKVLFFSYRRSEVEIYRSAQHAVLNTEAYGRVRNDVIAKLANHGKRFIADLKL